jgi:glutaredoxin
MVRVSIALLLGVLAAGAALGQQVYRWTDERGRVHITDTPPPPGAKAVQKSRAPAAAAGEASEPYALQMARRNAPVTLYSQPDCDACDRARKLLNARGVPFKEVSVLTEKQIEEMKQAGGGNTVPVLIVGANVQQGYEEGTYHAMLDSAGYPKTGVLPPRAQAEPKPPAPAPAAAPAAEKEKPAAEAEESASGPYSPGAARQRQKK